MRRRTGTAPDWAPRWGLADGGGSVRHPVRGAAATGAEVAGAASPLGPLHARQIPSRVRT